MNNKIPTYVLVRPGRTRDGLIALLRAIPQIGTVEQVTFELSELKSIPDHNQALVLLDASLINQELWNHMKQIIEGSFQTQCKCIVVADNILQQRMAKAAGADEVLLAGFPAAQLFTTIEGLFNRMEIQPYDRGGSSGSTATRQTI